MPDVKDSEKAQIRHKAKAYAMAMLDAPMSQGLEIYSEGVDKLYQRSARWKICLKCGEINKKENLDEETHSCSAGIDKLPVIIPTSWVVLRDFFLADDFAKVEEKLGKQTKATIQRTS